MNVRPNNLIPNFLLYKTEIPKKSSKNKKIQFKEGKDVANTREKKTKNNAP